MKKVKKNISGIRIGSEWCQEPHRFKEEKEINSRLSLASKAKSK